MFSLSPRRQFLVVLGLSFSVFLAGCISPTNEKNTINIENNKVTEMDFRNPIIGGKQVEVGSLLEKNTVLLVVTHVHKKTQQIIDLSSCTGSLIDTNIVLTAAHCFLGPEDSKVPARMIGMSVRVLSGKRPFNQKSKKRVFVDADAVMVHPRFLDKEPKEGDIALVRLSEPLPGDHAYFPLDSNTFNFKTKDTLIAVGYGHTKGYDVEETMDRPLKMTHLRSNKRPGFREELVNDLTAIGQTLYEKTLSKTLSDARQEALAQGQELAAEEELWIQESVLEEVNRLVNDALPNFTYSSKVESLVFDQRGSDGVCSGDSGGPGLRRHGEGYRIVGVARTVFSFNPLVESCRQGSTYTNVSYHKRWIIKTFNELANDQTMINRTGSSLFK